MKDVICLKKKGLWIQVHQHKNAIKDNLTLQVVLHAVEYCLVGLNSVLKASIFSYSCSLHNNVILLTDDLTSSHTCFATNTVRSNGETAQF